MHIHARRCCRWPSFLSILSTWRATIIWNAGSHAPVHVRCCLRLVPSQCLLPELSESASVPCMICWRGSLSNSTLVLLWICQLLQFFLWTTYGLLHTVPAARAGFWGCASCFSPNDPPKSSNLHSEETSSGMCAESCCYMEENWQCVHVLFLFCCWEAGGSQPSLLAWCLVPKFGAKICHYSALLNLVLICVIFFFFFISSLKVTPVYYRFFYHF